MIVEFIGCDGAGKTTLAQMVRDQGVWGERAVSMPDLVLDRTVLRQVTHPTAVNVVQEACSLPVLLSSWNRHRAFLDFGVRTFGRYATSTFDRLNGMRGLARRVGMYELARRRAPNRVVLSDEGTVLTAYHFALSEVDLDPRDVARFASLVPRPDWIVHVKAPVPALVRRAASRLDRRRQHVGRSPDRIERTIRRTVDVFDLVAAAPPLRDRVIVVENDDGDPSLRRELVDALAGRLQTSSRHSPRLRC